jgi:hypothetical protein
LERCTTSTILDFYEDSDVTSKTVAHKLEEFISKLGISGKQLVAFSADYCSVNNRKNNSGCVKFTNSFYLPNLIAGHYNKHIFHNAAKHAVKLRQFYVEMSIVIIVNELPSCAKQFIML